MAIIICGDTSSVWFRPFDNKNMIDIDATIAEDHMVLMAEDLGLASCWLTYFKPDIVRKEFNLPNHYEPVVILSIGYSAEQDDKGKGHLTARKPIESFVKYNTY